MAKKPVQSVASKPPVGRPSKPMPKPIPDTPKNVARAIMREPPKKNWGYLKKKPG